MKMLKRALISLGLIALASLTPLNAQDASLAAIPPYSLTSLSPDGLQLASYFDGGEENRYILVLETQTGKQRKITAANSRGGNAKIAELHWTGPEHLAFTAEFDYDGSTRLFSHKVGAKKPTRRSAPGIIKLIQTDPGSSTFLTIETRTIDGASTSQILEYKADSQKTPKEWLNLEQPIAECLVDAENRPRLIKQLGPNPAWLAFDPSSHELTPLKNIEHWTKVHGIVGGSQEAIISGHHGSEFPAIYSYDFTQDKILKTLADNPTFSLNAYAEGVLDPYDHSFLGLHLDLLERTSVWSDSEFNALQESINAKLPGSQNRISGWSQDREHLLVHRYIPNAPVQIFHFDPKTKQPKLLILNGPQLTADQLYRSQLVSLPNRNDQRLAGVLTLPKFKAGDKLPLIIWIRDQIWEDLDRLEWHPQASYFASQGYAVLRVNARGTAGMLDPLSSHEISEQGIHDFFDDLEDVRKAILETGIIDPKRIAIGGEKAAAWAAAYAPIHSPNTYQVVISLNGVYDLNEYRKGVLEGAPQLDLASAGSPLNSEQLANLSVTSNLTPQKYATTVITSLGAWSEITYKAEIASFQKALKKAKVSVKLVSDDWWGNDMTIPARYTTYTRVAEILKKALK